MRVVLPDFLRRELPAVRQRPAEHLAVPVPSRIGAVLIELPRRGAAHRRPAAGPYPVPHVGVGGVADPGLPQVAKVRLVFLNLLVATGQVQRDLGHVVHADVADVPDRDACVGITLLDLREPVGRAQVGRRADADVSRAKLLEKQQLLIRRSRRRLHAQLDPGRYPGLCPPASGGLPARQPQACPREGGRSPAARSCRPDGRPLRYPPHRSARLTAGRGAPIIRGRPANMGSGFRVGTALDHPRGD